MNLLIEEEGCYNCTAYYCDKPLKNNTFTLLVLTGGSLLLLSCGMPGGGGLWEGRRRVL